MNPAEIETRPGERYLKLYLAAQIPAILAMEYVQEVLMIPARRITPIPNMPECVLGLLNHRNRVVWAIDLAQILSLQPLDTNIAQYNVIFVQAQQMTLGLLVLEVKSVTYFTPDLVQSPKELVTSALIPFLHGCIVQEQELLLVLNAEAILRAPALYRK
jgi:positive phototaxis protein PixI